MNMTAGVMLLVVVAVVVVLAGAGAVWALKAAPQGRRHPSRRPRGRARGAARPAVATGLAAAAAGGAEATPERTLAQSDEERIEAMRALLHRGDEKARKLAAEGDQPAFADTQAFDDPNPPTLPLNWSHSRSGPATKPPGDSGHIPL